MSTQVVKTAQSPHPLAWIVGIAVILFSVAGFAAIMGWIPTSIGGAGNLEADKSVKKSAQAVTPKTKTPPTQVASNAPASTKCSTCGVIESVREIAEKGEGSGLGAAGGAVVGGLLGHQVGGGTGKQIATVVGAVGGAVAGNEVEKRVKATKSYDITVRLDDGSTRVINEANPPSWRNGDRVKIVDGAIRAI
ncbi:MAG: glycine zipper 2TM domain-containing protein [Burkholderiales bacterium]|nr:glycine zipper 2TM domain-containing protein [Burkholderiales bacterium]